MLTNSILFLDGLEQNKIILFLKNDKLDDSPLKNQPDDQP